MKKITIVGTWQPEKTEPYRNIAEEVGKLLATEGFELITGGDGGVPSIVTAAYKEHRGKNVVAYVPSKQAMEAIGAELSDHIDEVVETDTDYPGRNLEMLRNSEVLIGCSGGIGTLSELIHGKKDYKLPIALFNTSGIEKIEPDAYDFIQAIPELHEYITIYDDIKQLTTFLETIK